jgi:hypothetical protein
MEHRFAYGVDIRASDGHKAFGGKDAAESGERRAEGGERRAESGGRM